MSPLWSWYEHLFSKNHICSQGITYNACLFVIWSLNFFLQNGYLKFFTGWVWGKKSTGEGLVALWSLLTLEKWKRTFNFSMNWTLSKVYANITSIRTIYDHRTELTTLSQALRVCVNPGVFEIWCFFPKWLSQNFYQMGWKKMGVWRVALVAPWYLLTVKM